MTEKVLQMDREKSIFWGLLGVLLFCACFYMYLINTTVHNVVARQNLENELTQLSLSIGSQEFEYITKRNSITLGLALSKGFQNVENKTYLTRSLDSRFAFR